METLEETSTGRARTTGIRLPGSYLQELWPAYLLALILILWGFTWSLPDHRSIDKSFHADENAAVWAVDQLHFPGMNPHWFNWGTALFYQTFALKLLVSAGGLKPVDDAGVLVLGRVVVLLSALGAITCLFLLGRDLFGAPAGRVAAVTLAVLPGFAINSHYFKTDIPMTFWLLAAFVAGYRLVETRQPRYVYWLGFLIGYAVSNKYSAAAAVPAAFCFLAMSGTEIRKIRYWLLFGVFMLGGFLFGTPRVLPNPREFVGALRFVTEVNSSLPLIAAAHGPGIRDYLTRISQLSLTWPIWLAAAVSLLWFLGTRSRLLLPVWVFLVCYSLVLSKDNMRLMRYTVPLLPFAALFAAGLWGDLRRAGRVGRIASLAIFPLIAYSLIFSLSYVRVMTLTDPRVQAGFWIAAHVPSDAPIPVSTMHYLSAPQVELWSYQKLDVKTDADLLRNAASPYLVFSEAVFERYHGAVDHYPATKQFFDYVAGHYTEVARFENPQRLLGISSKDGLPITEDWLTPNPRITIYRRVSW